jgi:hypothetical protein
MQRQTLQPHFHLFPFYKKYLQMDYEFITRKKDNLEIIQNGFDTSNLGQFAEIWHLHRKTF